MNLHGGSSSIKKRVKASASNRSRVWSSFFYSIEIFQSLDSTIPTQLLGSHSQPSQTGNQIPAFADPRGQFRMNRFQYAKNSSLSVIDREIDEVAIHSSFLVNQLLHFPRCLEWENEIFTNELLMTFFCGKNDEEVYFGMRPSSSASLRRASCPRSDSNFRLESNGIE